MPTAYPPINRYSTLFELSNFKNSLKSLASAGVAIEGPSQKFERPQSFLDWARQPVSNRTVRIGQAHDGKLRAVESKLIDPVLRRRVHNSSLSPNQSPWPLARRDVKRLRSAIAALLLLPAKRPSGWELPR